MAGRQGRQGRVIPSQLAHQRQLTSGLQPRGYPKPLHPLASRIGGAGTGRQKIASVTGNNNKSAFVKLENNVVVFAAQKVGLHYLLTSSA